MNLTDSTGYDACVGFRRRRGSPWPDDDVALIVGYAKVTPGKRMTVPTLNAFELRLGRTSGAVAWVERFARRLLAGEEIPKRWENRIARQVRRAIKFAAAIEREESRALSELDGAA